MDELLKRLAKERREKSGTEFELHPATRRILQEKVARTFPESKSKAKASFFFWPRLALMGVFTALLALALSLLNTPRKSKPAFDLAQRAEQPALSTPEPLTYPAKEEAVAIRRADEQDFSKKQNPPAMTAPLFKREINPQALSTRDRDDVASGGRTGEKVSEPRAAVALPENRPVQSPDGKLAFDRATVRAEATVETATTAQAMAARSLKPGFAPTAPPVQLDTGASSLVRMRFVQQDLRAKFRQNLQSPPPSKILQSFEVVRMGNRIQLFDSDGSIYVGEILDPNSIASKKDFQDKAPEPSSFAFRATGTNRPLHRLVTIRGNFSPSNVKLVSNGTSKAKTVGALSAGELKVETGLSAKASGSIRGRLSIGGTNEFEIQAVELP